VQRTTKQLTCYPWHLFPAVLLQVALRLRGAISSKQLGYEDLLAPLIAEACIDVVPTNPHNFNVDNVRIVKIMGGALPDSQVCTLLLM
jgi:T-complex protein 1 subunit theta